MSLGLHKGWKKRLVSEMKEGEGLHVLDLATGTGDIAELVSKRSNVTSVIGVDPSKGMLEVARSRNVSKNVRYEIGDAQHLDYDDQSFDRILMSFGIRNVPNTEKALKEIKRILKPGGEALIMEFSLPSNFIVRFFYLNVYLLFIGSLYGLLFARDVKAYLYLRNTIRDFPSGHAFEELLRSAGFVDVKSQTLLFGGVTIYTANNKMLLLSHD